MVTSKDILNFIKNYINCSKYTMGYVEEHVEDSLCLYFRSGTTGTFEYDKNHSTILPVTVVFTGSKNYTNTEIKMQDFYNEICFINHINLKDDIYISIIPAQDMLPQFLSRNEEGFYQWAIDLNIHVY